MDTYPCKPLPLDEVEDIGAQTLINYEALCQDGWRLANLVLGPHNDPLITLSKNHSKSLSYKSSAEEFANQLQPAKGHTTRLYHYRAGAFQQVQLSNARLSGGLVQPYGDDKYLVQISGSKACVVDRKGDIQWNIKLGLQALNIQVSDDKFIWVGYGDQGAYSSYQNTGGLARYNKKGYTSFSGNHYGALNVAPNGVVWFESFSGMSKIVNGKIEKEFTSVPNGEIQPFAAHDESILFSEGYGSSRVLWLFNMQTEHSRYFRPVDETGKAIAYMNTAARGSRFYFADRSNIYFIDLATLPGKTSD